MNKRQFLTELAKHKDLNWHMTGYDQKIRCFISNGILCPLMVVLKAHNQRSTLSSANFLATEYLDMTKRLSDIITNAADNTTKNNDTQSMRRDLIRILGLE